MAVRDNQLVAQALVIALSVIMDEVLSDRVACCAEINDEATFTVEDVHMMSAQMRTRGMPGIPFFKVFERRRSFLTRRDRADLLRYTE